MRILIAIIFCFLFAFNSLIAQKTLPFFLKEKRYTVENGLPDNWVKDMLFDNQGFIWLATLNGISKFDSYNFINFSQNSSMPLKNHAINSMILKGDDIWAASDSGIEIVNTLNYKRQFIEINKSYGRITKIIQNKKGEVFIFQNSGFLTKIKNKKFSKSIYFEKQWFKFMLFDDDENILLAFNSGLVCIIDSDKFFQFKEFQFKLKMSESLNLVNLKDQSIIIRIDKNYFQWIGKKNLIAPFSGSFLYSPSNLNYSTNSLFYTGLYNTKLVKHDLKTNQNFSYNLNVKNAHISKIIGDKNENIFISTNQGFLVYKQYPVLPTFLEDKPPVSAEVKVRRAIIKQNDSLVILLNYENIEFYNLKNHKSRKHENLNRSITGYSGIIHKDILWIGLDGGGIGAYDLKNDDFKRYSETKDSVFFMKVNHIEIHNDSMLIIGTDKGLKLFNINKKELFDINKSIKSINYLLKISNNKYLIAEKNFLKLVDGFLEVKDLFQLEIIKEGVKIKPIIAQLLFDVRDKNIIWLSTNFGLFKYNVKKNKIISHVQFSNNIGGNIITYILFDNKNRIWASTYNGIYCYNLNNKTIFPIKIADLPIENSADLSDEYNYKSGLMANDSQIIFGGLTHYISINPNHVSYDFASDKLFFTKIEVSDSALADFNTNKTSFKSKLKLEYNHIRLLYSINNYSSSNDYTYFYKIDSENEWINIGNQSQLDLFNLPSGFHTIYIKAKNHHGVLVKNILKFEFYLPRIFYKSIMFYIILTISVILLLFLYLKQKEKYYKNVLNIKQQISYDLHDEIGSILTGTAFLTDLIQKKNPEVNDIKVVGENLRTAIKSMRDMIWAIDSSEISINGLVDRLADVSNQMFYGQNIELTFDKVIANENIKFSAVEKRYFILFTKESITNVIKHSKATKCHVFFKQARHKIELSISDNGIGFETRKSNNGIGLKAIFQRANIIHGKYSVFSDENGTKIVITVEK
ncbi:MAG: two-component regulator propeller domain-containing protein [Bacteroidota bacterium]|nr:two-component regulator propeller domain-containing protein [Bacteroidota bacterium]